MVTSMKFMFVVMPAVILILRKYCLRAMEGFLVESQNTKKG